MINRNSGEIRQAQIFVAVLGCSNYTYVEASWTKTLADWLGAHARAPAFLGVIRAGQPEERNGPSHRSDPNLNRAYAEFAEHYGVTILPSRVRKPRHKSKDRRALDAGTRMRSPVLLAQRLHLAKLAQNAALEDLDTRTLRGIDPKLTAMLAALNWIKTQAQRVEHCILRRGQELHRQSACACEGRADQPVRSHRLLRLIEELASHHAHFQSLGASEAARHGRCSLHHDCGLSPLSDRSKRDLLEILGDRYDKKSTLIPASCQSISGSRHRRSGDAACGSGSARSSRHDL